MTFLSRKASPRFCQLPFRGQRRRFLLQFCLMVFPGQIFLQLKLSSQSPLFFHSFSHVMMSCVFSDLADTFCSNKIISSSGTIFYFNGKIRSNWTNSNICYDGTSCSICSNGMICSNGTIGSYRANSNICSNVQQTPMTNFIQKKLQWQILKFVPCNTFLHFFQ